MKIGRMRFACWILKATNTHSKYEVLTVFFSATVVARTRVNVTFIRTEHCLCCSFYNKIIRMLDCTVKDFDSP